MKLVRVVALSAAALALFLMAGCSSSTRIGDILADASKYDGKEVSIKGTVGQTAWFAAAGKGAYQLGDGSGTIWVITTQPPPQEGLSASTHGTVQPAFSLLGRSYGTVLIETKRG